MGIWIRTQERERLIMCRYIDITTNPNEIYIYGGEINAIEILATYPTKERALQVIDEIQESVNLGYVPYRVANQKTQKYQVYEMPKE